MTGRQLYRSRGLCGECGKRRSKLSRCGPCAEKHRVYQRLHRKSKPLPDWEPVSVMPITKMLDLAAKIAPRMTLSYLDVYGRKEVTA